MSKYKIILKFPDGIDEEIDEIIFDNEESAVDYAEYLISCDEEGADILNESNPGDYPLEFYQKPTYEIVER